MTAWDDKHWRARYANAQGSATLRENRRAVHLNEFPDVDANIYVTMTELRRMAIALHVGPDDTFVDLGCGTGGPGLWVARETGARLLGIDLITVALERAERAEFQRADIQATGLPAESLDGATSIDVCSWKTRPRRFEKLPASSGRMPVSRSPLGRATSHTWWATRPSNWEIFVPYSTMQASLPTHMKSRRTGENKCERFGKAMWPPPRDFSWKGRGRR
jgi:hypothetical protein